MRAPPVLLGRGRGARSRRSPSSASVHSRMRRRGCEATFLQRFNRLAAAHDEEALAHVVDHRKVVADEEVGQAALGAKTRQEVQDLGLDRGVEREVGSSRSRTDGSRISARAIAMRWRWPPESWCGRRKRKAGSSPTSDSAWRDPPVAILQPMDRQRLGQDAVDRVARVAASRRGPETPSGRGRRSACRAAPQPFAIDPNLARRDRRQPADGAQDRGLA